MSGEWETFPAAMGEDQAWLTCCVSYADQAKSDVRNNVVRVQLSFKNPTEAGMPTSEEYPELKRVDQELERSLGGEDTIYVGRVTVAAKRFFYFYTRLPEQEVAAKVADVAQRSGYRLNVMYEADENKQRYWQELYPTDDDWQVIRDLSVIDQLNDNDDDNDIARDVQHWAYFDNDAQRRAFVRWLEEQGYRAIELSEADGDRALGVTFMHTGTMRLGDITHHTIRCARKAREFGGDYDGWETSVEVRG